MYLRNCHNVHNQVVQKPTAPPKPAVKKINCTEVLKNGNRIDCSGLDRKGCTLRSWEWAVSARDIPPQKKQDQSWPLQKN